MVCDMNKLILLLTLPGIIILSACAVTTAGVKKGDERNFVRSVNDVTAARAIKARMKRAEGFKLGGVNVDVAEGIVVLAGNVTTTEDKIEAERIAWSAPRVTKVGNEILIKDKQSMIRNTKDGVLQQAVRARLIADNSVKARNINLEVHDGIVYLLGVARTSQELERAAKVASTTKGAREVISYMKLADQNLDGTPNDYAAAPTPSTPRYSPPESSTPSAGAMPYTPPASAAPSYRDLPQGLSHTPLAPDALPDTEPYYLDPQTGERIELPPGTKTIPYVPDGPGSLGAGALPPPVSHLGGGTPARVSDMGAQLGQAFPSDSDLGKYRSGASGETVSVIESAPYYIDPDTGKEIPISFVQGR